jgi:RimJ/RimL family protein N-acetyltransferase
MTTNRLIIEDLNAMHFGQLLKIMKDPRVNKYAVWRIPEDEHDIYSNYIYNYMTYGKLYPVYHKDDTINIIGFLKIARVNDWTASVGYYLKPDEQGKGYATELLQGVLRELFLITDVQKIVCTCDPLNKASELVMKKAGMMYEATIKYDKRNENTRELRDSTQYCVYKLKELI